MASLGLLVATASTCSLGNVQLDDCQSNTECATLFGAGSKCVDGGCTDPGKCRTPSECQESLGYGATCRDGVCAASPLDDRCHVVGPESVVTAFAAGQPTKDAVVFGAVFDLAQDKEQARAAAVELAIEDMNAQGGTRPLAVVVCNSNSTDGLNTPVDLARYLARDIGTPALVGPSTTQAVGDVATALYETERLARVVVTPAATGIQLSDQPDTVDGSTGLLYRTCISDDVQAARLAVEMDARVPTGTFVILYQNDQYGQSYENVLRAGLPPSRVGPSFYFDGVTPDGMINQAILNAAGVAGVAGVAIVSNRVDLTRQLLIEASTTMELSMTQFFLTDGSKDRSLIDGFDPDVGFLDRIIGVAQRDTQNPTFFGRLNQKTGFDPSQYSFVSNAYDAAFVLGFGAAYADATAQTIDGPNLAAALTRLSSGDPIQVGTVEFKKGITSLTNSGGIDLDGISGTIDFDTKGDVVGSVDDVATWCLADGLITTCN